MLIHIDRSGIDDAASASAGARESRAAIENLLRAHGEGQHLVSIDPEYVMGLAPVVAHFSERAVGVLERIEFEASAIAGMRARLAYHLAVGVGAGFEAPSFDGHVLRADLRHFARFERAVRAILLCENLIDTRFYRKLAEAFLVARRRSEVCLAFDSHGGGGDQTANELSNAAATGRVLLAIVDSDRRFPEGTAGGTWHRVEPIVGTLLPFQRARSLVQRMIENLVPVAVYRAAFAANRSADGRLQSLSRLEPLHASLAYADLKHGIRLFQIEEEMEGDEQEHWRRVASAAGRIHCRQGTAKKQQRACEGATKRDACACYVVDSLGTDALRDVVAWMEQYASLGKIARLFALADASGLTDLCEELVAWGCAANELVT